MSSGFVFELLIALMMRERFSGVKLSILCILAALVCREANDANGTQLNPEPETLQNRNLEELVGNTGVEAPYIHGDL